MTAAPRTIGVGVIGLGFMGRTHLAAYRAAAAAGNPCRLVAVSDPDPARLSGRAPAAGNLRTGGEEEALFDPAQVRASADPAAVLADPEVELVSICTPTDTHVELALRALAAKKHVLVEKPVSLDASEIDRLALEARRHARLCVPAMCMRFWPGWSWLRAAVRDGRYGRVHSAVFQRCGSRPAWGAGFYADARRSGGALFDLHVHDADLVHWLFGAPDSVASAGSPDHVTTLYHYANGPAHVVAEGGWDHAPGFPFRMRYVVAFERATVEFDLRRDPPLEVTVEGRVETPRVEPGTGYDGEARAVLLAVRSGVAADLPTLEEAAAVTCTLLRERQALAR